MNNEKIPSALLKVMLVYLVGSLFLAMPGCALRSAPTPTFHCEDALGCVDIAPGEALRLGGLQTLSGGSEPGGLEQERSIQLAVEKRKNQLLGHPIILHFEDDLCSAEGGANAMLRIVADPKVVAVFGPNCSSAAVTAGKIMAEKGLVMVSSSNTAPGLTSVAGKAGEDWSPGYFRTVWNDASMGRAAATFAFEKLRLKKAAVINTGGAYSKGLADAFLQDFEKQGGSIVLKTTIDEDDADQNAMLKAVQLSGAEFVFLPLSQPKAGGRILRQAKSMPALQDLVWIAGESMLSDIFVREVGEAGIGVYILGPSRPAGTATETIRQDYLAKYGELPPSFYYAFAFDAVNLTLDSIEKVAVQDADGTLHIGRQKLRDALYATKDYPGVTGSLTCDAFGDCSAATLNVVRLDDVNTDVEELRANVIYTFSGNP